MVDYEELADQAEKDGPTDEEIKTISGLVARQCRLEDELEALQKLAREKGNELNKMQFETLPEAMLNAGCSSYTDANGNVVGIKEDIKAGMTEKTKPWCFGWLRKTNNGDLIRNEFKITYGVGQDDDAKSLVDTLKEQGQDFNQKEYVHPRTLPAFCRSHMEENETTEEWEKNFGIFPFKVAKITRPE